MSVINTNKDRVKKTIKNVGPLLRGIAVTDSDEKSIKVYVTQFLAQLRSGKTPADEGRDDSKEGRVTVVVFWRIRTKYWHSGAGSDYRYGFKSNGSTLDRIARRRNEAGIELPEFFDFTTGAFPNLLESIVIKGNLAYVVGTCSSPNGPFRFNVNVQSCLSTIDITSDREAFPTLNMNRGVQFESVGDRLFNANPFALAFKNAGHGVCCYFRDQSPRTGSSGWRWQSNYQCTNCSGTGRAKPDRSYRGRKEPAGTCHQLDRHPRICHEFHFARCLSDRLDAKST